MRWVEARVLYRAAKQWNDDSAAQMGAALAYYALFSIAPLLLIALTIAGLFFGAEVARARVAEQLTEFMGEDSSKGVQALADELTRPGDGGWASVLGFGALFVGALGVFLHLRTAFCTIWRLVPPTGTSWLGILFNYLLAAVMVLLIGLLLLLSLASNTVLVMVTEVLERNLPDYGISWQAVEFASSVFYLSLLFALVFHIMSGRRILLRHVWIGAVAAAALFTIGKTLLGWYLAYTGTTSAYGAAGSLVAFLIWVYYSAQIVFFGAELIQAWRTRHEWLAPKP
jgi:membrane protein